MKKTKKNHEEILAAQERAELYFAAHPRSPAAVRRPKLSTRSDFGSHSSAETSRKE